MSYCALADITAAMPEGIVIDLTDDEALGAVNSDRVDDAIAHAETEINSWLGRRYEVPLSSVPALVTKVCVDIAIWNLYSRTGIEPPDVRRQRYKDAVAMLKAIAEGKASLGVDAADEPDAPDTDSGARTTQDSDSQTFTRDTMESF